MNETRRSLEVRSAAIDQHQGKRQAMLPSTQCQMNTIKASLDEGSFALYRFMYTSLPCPQCVTSFLGLARLLLLAKFKLKAIIMTSHGWYRHPFDSAHDFCDEAFIPDPCEHGPSVPIKKINL